MPIKKELSLILLTSMAVFSTSKLIFWDKTIANWDSYLVLHLIVIVAVCGMIDLVFRISNHKRTSEANPRHPRRQGVNRWIVGLASAGVLLLAGYLFTHRGVQPIFF